MSRSRLPALSVDLPGPPDYGKRHANRQRRLPLEVFPSARAAREWPRRATAASRPVMKRQNIQPASLSKRVVGGHVLYSHVVVVEGKKTIFVSGHLPRGPGGEVVGARGHAVPLPHSGDIIKAAR